MALTRNEWYAHGLSAFTCLSVAAMGWGIQQLNPPVAAPTVKAIRVQVLAPSSKAQASQDLSEAIPIQAQKFVPDTVDAPKLNKNPEVAKTVQDAPKQTTDEDVPELTINPEIIPSDKPNFEPPPNVLYEQYQAQNSTEFGVPPAPDDFTIPLEVYDPPNVGILVLALQVNDMGLVTDVRILVPSGDPQWDLIFGLKAKGSVYSDINPPIEKGTQRWLPYRVKITEQASPLIP